MRPYTYFPGCSSSDGNSLAYGRSTEAVSTILDVELRELENWNCCGSTPYRSVDHLASLCLSARNLSLAEESGLDLVTPCSSCYVLMNNANDTINESPDIREQIDESLAAGGLGYSGGVRVRHLLDVFVNDIGFDSIHEKVQRNLDGLKVGAYYGCQIVRPDMGFDHPEYPESLDNLVASLGASPVEFPLKSRCCGGSLIISNEDLALELIRQLLESAVANGAECLVTVCPLCQTNLDVYQKRVNNRFNTNFDIPVLFFTQLMGFAFGLGDKELMLQKCIIPAEKTLKKFY